MSESKRGVVAPRRSQGPYETFGLPLEAANLRQLAEHIATIYLSEATSKIVERLEALDGDREKAVTLLGEALLQIAGEAAKDHLSKQRLLGHLLSDIKTAADQKIFALERERRPLEGVMKLATGQLVSFANGERAPGHDGYRLNLESNVLAGGRRWREEYSIKLTDVQERTALGLPASRTFSIEDHIRQDFVRDGQDGEYLARVTGVRQENRPGYDPDCYHWSSYWLPEHNELLVSWGEFQLGFDESVRGHVLEAIAREASVKSLESSIRGGQAQQIRLAHTTPAALGGAEALFREARGSDRLPEEVRPDASIKMLRQAHRPPGNLRIELWQRRKDEEADSSCPSLNLGERIDIDLDARGRADIRRLGFGRGFPSPGDHTGC